MVFCGGVTRGATAYGVDMWGCISGGEVGGGGIPTVSVVRVFNAVVTAIMHMCDI
jgi:hypothetical protein